MKTHHVLAAVTTLLIAVCSPAFAEPDPMLGGYAVGKSSEVAWISATYATPTDVYIGMYDWDSAADTLIWLDSMLLFTCTASDRGPKQADIAVGDFNCDGKDDIVAVAQTNDTDYALIIPHFVPGTLTWDTPDIYHSAPGALYYDPDIRPDYKGNISGLRLLAADLDTIPGQEFLLAYLTPDTQLQLVMYKTDSLLNPIAVDSVLDGDKLYTTLASVCNERSHVFDITAGDFDGDWVDEIMLIGEYHGPDYYVLYASIYEYSGGSLHLVHRQDSIDWYRGVVPNVNFADRIAVAAADFHGTGRDQALLFLHYQWQDDSNCDDDENHLGRVIGLTPSDSLVSIGRADLVQWQYWWDDYDDGTRRVSSEHGLAAADLNLDGRAEFVIRGGHKMKVGSWDSTNTLTWHTDDVHLEARFDYWSESRRSTIFADMDADTAQASWTPELFVAAHDWSTSGDEQGHLKTFGVDIDTGQITGITLRHAMDLHDGALNYTWYAFVVAAGDFDGDGIRLGRPQHVGFTHTAEPLVVLNSPPMHYDILGTDTADVLGYYTEGNEEAYASYTTDQSQSQSVGASHASNWNVSASVGGSKDLWGAKFSAKVTAAYGGSSERISGTTTAHFTSEEVVVEEGDRGNVRSVPYDVWEYPIYVGDSLHGYYVVSRPEDDQAVKGWAGLEGLPSVSYSPKHEVGNLLSYPASLNDIMARDDVDTVLSEMSYWQVLSSGGGITQTYGATQISSDASSRTRTFSIDLEVEAELFGLETSSTASYDKTKVQTRSSTINDGFEISTRLGELTGAFASAEYRVTPVFFWSTSGALVLDYIVDSLAAGGFTWWTENYDGAPDPAFLLPWRYARAKGDSLSDTTKTWRTSDLYFRPYRPVRGEVVTIHGKVWNYSLDSLSQDVEIRLYDGDPMCDETSELLDTLVTGGIGPRQFKPFEFEWEVPLGAPANARIYAVLDPDDQIVEIHDNNNKCWRGVFMDAPTPPVCTTCPIVVAGDVNVDASITAADIIYVVNYVFKGGAVPDPCEAAGDVTCDASVTASDIISLVNHVFKGGPAPCDICNESSMACVPNP